MPDSYILAGDLAASKLQTYRNTVGADQVHSEAVTPTNSEGVPMATGAGTAGSDVLRVTIADDDPVVNKLQEVLAAIQALVLAVAIPTIMQDDFTLPAFQQASAHARIVAGTGLRIQVGQAARLVIL